VQLSLESLAAGATRGFPCDPQGVDGRLPVATSATWAIVSEQANRVFSVEPALADELIKQAALLLARSATIASTEIV
jgi:hypothetical protein